jgi:hypothetical protein
MKRWSDWERAQALMLRSQGLSIRAVAETLGVPSRTVGSWLRGCGDCHAVRSCELCGEPFLAVSARHRFCTPAHQRKHFYVFRTRNAIRERGEELEAGLAQWSASVGIARAEAT